MNAKSSIFTILVAIFLLLSSSFASALPFIDTIDFDDTTFTADGDTRTVIIIDDTGNTNEPGEEGYSPAFTYTHDVFFDPEAQSLTDAQISITHAGNRDNKVEAWFVMDNQQVSLGFLGDSQDPFFIWQDYDWVTTTFDLSAYIAGVSGSEWSIEFSIDENTLGVDERIYIDKSVLSGNYEPVPEPTSILLMGLGILGFAGLGRKMSKS